jgi:hypothetical protein
MCALKVTSPVVGSLSNFARLHELRKVLGQDRSFCSDRCSSLAGWQARRVSKRKDVRELGRLQCSFVDIDPPGGISQWRGLDELKGSHGRDDMQEVVRTLDLLLVPSGALKDGNLILLPDLDKVGVESSIQATFFAQSVERLVVVGNAEHDGL